jgi:hypothetical protein
MRRVKLAVLPATIVVAVGLMASSSALGAPPEWGQCVKGPKGKYNNASCTGAVVTGGEYEWIKGTRHLHNVGFTSTGGEAELRTTDGIATDCTSETASGKLSGTKNVIAVVVTFQGCHANLAGLICTGGEFLEEQTHEGFIEEKPGEIQTRILKGKLGYIEGKGTATPVVGLELTPEMKRGLFAQFICGGTLVVRVGAKHGKGNGGDSIISPIGPVNQMGTTATQVYTQGQECEEEVCHGNGIQIPSHFEGGKQDVLETEISDNFGEIEWAKSAQTLTTVNTLEEEIEIRA